MISVIIPTLNSPEALNLCLKSAINGQQQINHIVVAVNGFFETNKDILAKYAKYIDPVIYSTNLGTCDATNRGVYRAKHNKILIVNDDNVFPENWDIILEQIDISNSVIAPNQIEPYTSIFRQFIIQDLGRDPSTFDLEAYWSFEKRIRKNIIESSGSTFPIFMNKSNFLKVGGFDKDYPLKSGAVADWDFFLKCELSGLSMLRTYQCMFYHFVSVSTKQKFPETPQEKTIKEMEAHQYFFAKWGRPSQHNPETNSKMLEGLK